VEIKKLDRRKVYWFKAPRTYSYEHLNRIAEVMKRVGIKGFVSYNDLDIEEAHTKYQKFRPTKKSKEVI